MIKIIVEMWPGGDKSRKRIMAEGIILGIIYLTPKNQIRHEFS
jgi:hypothetical protein